MRRRSWVLPLFVVVAVLGAVALSVGFIYYRSPEIPESEVMIRPVETLEDGYITSDACEACHPREYQSWHASYHRSMTQVASPSTVIPSFDGVDIGAVRANPMHLERRGSELWAEFDDPDYRGRNGETRRISRPVVMMTGSHHQQAYWYATGLHRLISKLPAMYLVDDRRWIPRRAAFLHPADEPPASGTGGWNGICISCHTTNGKSRIDTPLGSRPVLKQVVESNVSEFGVACEACHGPGDEHAGSNRNPARRYWFHLSGQPDRTVVQPQRLDPRRPSEVCGQCHSVWEFYDIAGERRANSIGLPYRPGDQLRDTRFIAQPTANLNSSTMREILSEDPAFMSDSFWPDGMIRVSGREFNGLIESPCFKAADQTQAMTCFSCHSMHKRSDDPRTLQQWADQKQLSAGMDGNQACLQCHPQFRTNLAQHTKHQGKSGNLCYNCHMPYTTYGLLRALRSHQVSSASVAASVSTGRPNACNGCHLDKTLQWTADYLDKWYGIERPKLNAEEATISAAVLWLLRGDAGQRALIAWSLGWQPAQQASGVHWIAPILGQVLDDPYEAVRMIASRSLKGLPGFADFDYDFLSQPDLRATAPLKAINVWRGTLGSIRRRNDPAVLLDSDGNVTIDLMNRIKQERDNHPMSLREKRTEGAAFRDDQPTPAKRIDYARRHLRFGWWTLLMFTALGLVLETLHGFKAGVYVDVSNQTRRLMWTLAHTHGTLLSIVNLIFALTLRTFPEATTANVRLASNGLVIATFLLPGGFFLGGVLIYGGDPGLGVLLVPVGAVLLLIVIFLLIPGRSVPVSDQGTPNPQREKRPSGTES